MGFYILKRLLFIIPFSLLIVFFTLILNQHFASPSFDTESYQSFNNKNYHTNLEQAYCSKRNALHLDWPNFYITISPRAIPSNIQEICLDRDRQFVEMLCLYNGNQVGALEVYRKIKSYSGNDDLVDIQSLLNSKSPRLLMQSNINSELQNIIRKYKSNTSYGSIFIPRISFNGVRNRFHYWLSNALYFDFGKSNTSGIPVTNVVGQAVKRTVSFTIPAVIITFMLAIALGLFIALYKGKISSLVLNLLYFIDAIPLFWLSILLITVTGSFYFSLGSWKSLGQTEALSIWDHIQNNFFPIIALVIVSLPYLTKQVYSSVNRVNQLPHIQTVLAMGISRSIVITKHILPNAAIPINTLFFNYMAFAFGGAFVVEVVFSIDGIGKLMADSIMSNDFQVVSLILLFLVLVKMLLMILSDFLNYLINPLMKLE